MAPTATAREMNTMTTMTSRLLVTAANYEEMFKGLLGPESGWVKEIKNEIAWAKRVLKKSDRVIWYLRWYRLSVLKTEDPSDGSSDVYAKELAAYQAKAGTTNFYVPDATPGETRHTHQTLEHYFSLQVPGIQDYHPGYKSLLEVTSDLEELETEFQERGSKYLPEHDGDQIIIKMPNGWAWWKLSRGYCPEEAKAMGHCGNGGSGNSDNETILSYREPVKHDGKALWEPHLTFILDEHGYLGEMKGKKNNKPEPKYHAAIEALLKSDYVEGIKGGGYKPENNFSMLDLPEKEMKALGTEKPTLLDVKGQYAVEGLSESLQERVLSALQGEYKYPQARWDMEEKRLEVISRVWPTNSLLQTFGDTEVREIGQVYEEWRFTEEAPEGKGTGIWSGLSREYDWKSLVPFLPEKSLTEIDAYLDTDADEAVTNWLNTEANWKLKPAEKAIGLIEAADDGLFEDILQEALRFGLFRNALGTMRSTLQDSIAKSAFRPYKKDADFDAIQWIVTLSIPQALDMASKEDPGHALFYFTDDLSDDVPEEERITAKWPNDLFTDIDMSAAAKRAAYRIHQEYAEEMRNRRNREIHKRKEAPKTSALRKRAIWMPAEDILPKDGVLSLGGVFTVKTVIREGDEIVIHSQGGTIRRVDPKELVAIQRNGKL
jgi:hypothetical protein